MARMAHPEKPEVINIGQHGGLPLYGAFNQGIGLAGGECRTRAVRRMACVAPCSIERKAGFAGLRLRESRSGAPGFGDRAWW